MNILVAFLLLLVLCAPSSPQRNGTRPSSTISYCDLFSHPDLATGDKLIRLRATWIYGFEWTYLSNSACTNQPKTWIEFADESSQCPATKKNLRKLGNKNINKPADVVMLGYLRRGGGTNINGYGYQYTFVVTCLENFKTSAGRAF